MRPDRMSRRTACFLLNGLNRSAFSLIYAMTASGSVLAYSRSAQAIALAQEKFAVVNRRLNTRLDQIEICSVLEFQLANDGRAAFPDVG